MCTQKKISVDTNLAPFIKNSLKMDHRLKRKMKTFLEVNKREKPKQPRYDNGFLDITPKA